MTYFLFNRIPPPWNKSSSFVFWRWALGSLTLAFSAGLTSKPLDLYWWRRLTQWDSSKSAKTYLYDGWCCGAEITIFLQKWWTLDNRKCNYHVASVLARRNTYSAYIYRFHMNLVMVTWWYTVYNFIYDAVTDTSCYDCRSLLSPPVSSSPHHTTNFISPIST